MQVSILIHAEKVWFIAGQRVVTLSLDFHQVVEERLTVHSDYFLSVDFCHQAIPVWVISWMSN